MHKLILKMLPDVNFQSPKPGQTWSLLFWWTTLEKKRKKEKTIMKFLFTGNLLFLWENKTVLQIK